MGGWMDGNVRRRLLEFLRLCLHRPFANNNPCHSYVRLENGRMTRRPFSYEYLSPVTPTFVR